MRLSVQISSFLVVLCVSEAFSSPSVDRAWDSWTDCYSKCGEPFGGDGMSDAKKLACIKGCCSEVRSLNPHVRRSEVRFMDVDEYANIDFKAFKKNYPKVNAWMNCVSSYVSYDWIPMYEMAVSECCDLPPLV